MAKDTTWQKILCSLRRLGDGTSFSALDDQSRMSIETMRKSFKAFCSAIKNVTTRDISTEFLTYLLYDLSSKALLQATFQDVLTRLIV